MASDRSHNLAQIAKRHDPHSVLVADILDVPHPAAKFDFAISIAVIHHFSTKERRIAAVQSVLELLRNNTTTPGEALLYVWALEQDSSRRGWKTGDVQDVMVPWVLKSKGQQDKTYQRYYHLYKKGELEEDIATAGGVVIESGYEKDNWWAIASRR